MSDTIRDMNAPWPGEDPKDPLVILRRDPAAFAMLKAIQYVTHEHFPGVANNFGGRTEAWLKDLALICVHASEAHRESMALMQTLAEGSLPAPFTYTRKVEDEALQKARASNQPFVEKS